MSKQSPQPTYAYSRSLGRQMRLESRSSMASMAYTVAV